MIAFKKNDENIYLITNYKVMFSTLKGQSSLVRVVGDRLFYEAVKSWLLFSRPKFFMVVRDPYDRIESFYKDKFLKAEEYRLWMIENKMERNWQMSTEIFFPFLDLDTSMSPSDVNGKLLSVSFQQFISLLPKVIMKDAHLKPQHMGARVTSKNLGFQLSIPIRFKKIFKLESEKDLAEITDLFNVDLKTKENSTKHIKKCFDWSQDSMNIIEGIYAKDFEQFEYQKRSIT